MKIYVDLIILLNFFLDFILLLSVSLILKRNVKISRIFLGAFVGGISILFLFINISSTILFFVKILISTLMVMITFSYKNIKYTLNNLIYLYLISIILGGFLYYVNVEMSYKNTGLIFFHNGMGINVVLIIILSPILLGTYVIKTRKLKEEYSKKYEVCIMLLNNKKINVTGFLDTGNNLQDPYKRRPIIVISKNALRGYNPKIILVPCITVKGNSLLKCFRIKELIINGKKIEKECLVGISDNNFQIDGVDLLLHKKLLGRWLHMKRIISFIKSLFKKFSTIFFVGAQDALPEPLSRQEELKYLEEASKGNVEAKNKLIEHNLRLVVKKKKKYESTKIDLEDLVSIGTIGLIKGINTYKMDKNIKLATYASRCIDNEILMYLRKNKKRNGDVSLEESLSYDSEGNELHLEDILGTDPDLVTKELEDNDLKVTLMKEINNLPERDKQIMKLRYGLFGEKEITQKELAEKLNISQSYISRIEKKVIKKIKETIKL